jgi:hypothetical protein
MWGEEREEQMKPERMDYSEEALTDVITLPPTLAHNQSAQVASTMATSIPRG